MYRDASQTLHAQNGHITINGFSKICQFNLESVTTWGGQNWSIRKVFLFPNSGEREIIRLPNGTDVCSIMVNRDGNNAIVKVASRNNNLEKVTFTVYGNGVKTKLIILFK